MVSTFKNPNDVHNSTQAIILILIYNFNLAFHMQIEFRNHNTVLYPLEVLANIELVLCSMSERCHPDLAGDKCSCLSRTSIQDSTCLLGGAPE